MARFYIALLSLKAWLNVKIKTKQMAAQWTICTMTFDALRDYNYQNALPVSWCK